MGLLYPGRVMLGVGTGEALNEIAVSGREWPEFKERFARLREAVQLMRELWTGEDVSFDGRVLQDRRRDDLRPARAAGPDLRRRGRPAWWRSTPAARATGSSARPARAWSSTPRSCCPPSPRARRPRSATPAAIDRMIEIKMSYDRDPDAALENCRFWAPLSLTAEQKHSVDSSRRDGAPRRRAADRAGRQALDRRLRPDEAVAQIKPYLDAGLNHLVFHGPGQDQERFLTQFTEDVLPKLRALA